MSDEATDVDTDTDTDAVADVVSVGKFAWNLTAIYSITLVSRIMDCMHLTQSHA